MSIFLGIIIAITSIVFAFQNTEFVVVSFLNYKLETSTAIVILSSLLVGFITALFFLTPSIFKTNLIIRRLKKQNKDLSERERSEGITYESEGLGESGEYRSK